MKTRYVIRPVQASDLDALYGLITLSTGGLTSLQSDREFLASYIQKSEDSFSGNLSIDAPHKYLLVVEADGQTVGCAAVKTRIGCDDHEAPFINFDHSIDGRFLTASDRFAGATEVGSLFLHPNFRKDGLGRYLAKARYMLIASNPERFSQTIIAELRGISGYGKAPFYDAVFKARLGQTFLDADNLYATTQAQALATITPDNPIHVSQLPMTARMAMGAPHPSGMGALNLLEREGFCDSRTIDLFDGGPIVAAYRDKITTIMQSFLGRAALSQDILAGAAHHLISLDNIEKFRAVITPANYSKKCIYMPQTAYEDLGASAHSSVRIWTRPLAGSKHV